MVTGMAMVDFNKDFTRTEEIDTGYNQSSNNTDRRYDMPGGDRTGPEGQGAGSGRKMGQQQGNMMGRGVGMPRGGGQRRGRGGRGGGRQQGQGRGNR